MSVPVVGEVIDAVVTDLRPYGAVLDSDGRPGIVLIPEVSWSRIGHPGDVLVVGERVRVKVLVAAPNHPFSASLRAMRPELDPWFDPERFAVGTEFDGVVERVMHYGCFIDLFRGAYGLFRREDWPRPLAVGDAVRVWVTDTDPIKKRVELSACPEVTGH